MAGRRRTRPVTTVTYAEKLRSKGEVGRAEEFYGLRVKLSSQDVWNQSSRNVTTCCEGGTPFPQADQHILLTECMAMTAGERWANAKLTMIS